MSFLLVALLRVMGPALVVEDDVGCPTARQAIEARLGQLSGAANATNVPARLRREGARIILQLEDAAGSLVATRDLPTNASCEQLARAAAVVLAAWQAEGVQGAVARPEEGPPRNVVQAESEEAFPSARGAANQPSLTLAALALGSANFDRLGGALELDAAGEFLFGGLVLEAPYQVNFGPGQLHLARESLLLGASFRLPLRPAMSPELEFRVAVVGSATGIWGSGYHEDEGGIGLGLGATGGIRLLVPVSQSLRLLFDVAAAYWFLGPQINVTGLASSYQPTPFEAFVGVGLAYETSH